MKDIYDLYHHGQDLDKHGRENAETYRFHFGTIAHHASEAWFFPLYIFKWMLDRNKRIASLLVVPENCYVSGYVFFYHVVSLTREDVIKCPVNVFHKVVR